MIARISEHYRKRDDAHDNPQGQKRAHNDQQPLVYTHLVISLKAPMRRNNGHVNPSSTSIQT
jgi:hypothetical protein